MTNKTLEEIKMRWICKIFGHRFWVSTAEVKHDVLGHYYIAHCKTCKIMKLERL